MDQTIFTRWLICYVVKLKVQQPFSPLHHFVLIFWFLFLILVKLHSKVLIITILIYGLKVLESVKINASL